MKLLCNTILAALSLFSLNAVAEDENQFDYLGFSLQNNSYDELDFSPQVDTTNLTPLMYNSSSSATGLRGFFGRQFNRYLAVEAGVTSFGQADFSVIQQETDAAGKTTNTTVHQGEFKTLATDIRAIGTYQLTDKLYLKAHIGAVLWSNDFAFLATENEALVTHKTSDSGVSLLTGIGIGYGFNDKVAIAVDFENTEISNITTKNLALSVFVRL
jgi:hypothetical protein